MEYPQKDPENQKANQVASCKRGQYKPGRRGRRLLDMMNRALIDVRQLFPTFSARVSRTIYYLKRGGDVYRRPATSSFSAAGPALIRRIHESPLDLNLSTYETRPIRIPRSRHAIRLHLFLLNILLVPTRCRHMLRYICEDS